VRRGHYRNAQRTLYRLLDMGVLPVVNENDTVATEEIRFGDNDRLAALVAHLVHADLLVLLSDVEGLFDGDPRRPGTRMLTEVTGDADLAGVRLGRAGASGLGAGGMASKVDAARIAAAAGIRAVVASAEHAEAVLTGAGRARGTTFRPADRRLPTRLLWLAYAATPRGELHLDPGAVEAVVVRRASLLPAGVTAAEGKFVAGDPVDLLDQNGHAVARGLVNFDVTEMPALLGRSTPDLARELGPAFSREVVHRDDLVLLR
jgi:glutamate 5-kinase